MHRSKESTTGPISKAFAGTSIWTVPKDDHIPTKRMGNRIHLLVKEPMQEAPEQIRPSPPTSARQLDDARFRHRIVHVGAQEAHAAEQNGDGEGLLDPDREFNDALDAVLQTRSIEMVMQFASDISGGSERLTDAEIDALIRGDRSGSANKGGGSSLEDHSFTDNDEDEDSDDQSDPGMETPEEEEDEANTGRAMEVRTPVDVPLELLPVGQQRAMLQADSDIRAFADEDDEVIPRRRNLRVNWYMPAHSWKVQQGIEHTMLHQSPRHDPNSGIQLGRALLEARAHDKKPGMKAFPKEDVEMTLKSAQNELLLQEMDSAKSFKAFLMKERGHVPHFLERCQGPSSPDPTSPRHKTSTCSTPRLPDVVAAGQQSPRPSMNATPRRGIEAS